MTETQMISMTTISVTRADRMAMPLARDVLRDVAIENGACIRPIQLRRTDRDTGQPKNARPGLVPGCCKGKAHDGDHLGYAGRRVLVSGKWSGKTLADHRADRQQWLLSALGVSATDPARYRWELVAPGDPDHMDHARRLLHAVADRARWQVALAEARRRAQEATRDPSAPGKGA